MGLTPIDRLYAKVVAAENNCQVFTGSKTCDGYGQLSVAGRNTYVHRMAWEIYRGPIPEGLEIDHECYRPNCVNPDHMSLKTHAENLRGRRRIASQNYGKTHCWAGHEYTEENTTYSICNAKLCKTCSRSTSS